MLVKRPVEALMVINAGEKWIVKIPGKDFVYDALVREVTKHTVVLSIYVEAHHFEPVNRRYLASDITFIEKLENRHE